VFIAIARDGANQSRQLLTCGYHGCLGVNNVNEDEFRLNRVIIPDLPDLDRIEFLI
jgi:hypothetical protein